MDVAIHTVSDAGSERQGPSSAVALGDRSLGGVADAHANTDRSLMTADLEAAAGQLVVGTLRLHLNRDRKGLVQRGPGARFGETAMLDNPARGATVVAVEDTESLLITRDAFFTLLKPDPALAIKVPWNMLRRLSANLRTTSEKLSRLENP